MSEIEVNKPLIKDDLIDFVNFLGSKSGAFNANNNNNCAIAQYFKSKGFEYVCVGSHKIWYGKDYYGEHITAVIPEQLMRVAYGNWHPNDAHIGEQALVTFNDAFKRGYEAVQNWPE